MRPRDPKKIDAIQEATLDVYAKDGFYGITIKKISDRSGLSVGAIYTYFKGKEEILESLFDKATERRVQQYPFLFSEKATVREDFEVIWNTVYRFESENFQLVMVADEFFFSPYITAEKKMSFIAEAKPVIERVQKAIDSGVLKRQHPILILKHIVSNIRNLIIAQNRDSFVLQYIDNPDVFKDFVWDGITVT